MTKRNSDLDKKTEYFRYEQRARKLLNTQINEKLGATGVPLSLREPYSFYELQIRRHLKPNYRALEIGAGTGMHTQILLELVDTGEVMVSDISESCLEVLINRYRHNSRLSAKVADMECMPFPQSSFDIVTSAGCLSYGDNKKVMMEIYRVLKPGGIFVCVDSLNHNPLYRLNRWLKYVCGKRSLSTLRRMPRIETIECYRQYFGSVDVRFFGGVSWITPLLNFFIGEVRSASFSRTCDELFHIKRSAYKFVMTAYKVKDSSQKGTH